MIRTHKLKLLIAGLASLLAIGFVSVPVAAVPLTTLADAKSEACEGIGATSGTGGCVGSGPTLNNAIKLALNIISWVAGIIAVIMVVIAGLKYITSQGDSSQVASAKNTLIYALVGVVVVMLAQAVVRFVLKSVK